MMVRQDCVKQDPSRAPPKTHANTIKPIVIELMIQIRDDGSRAGCRGENSLALDTRHSFSGGRHDIHDVVTLKTGPIVNAATLEIIDPADHRRSASRGQRRNHRTYGQASRSLLGGGRGRSSVRSRCLRSSSIGGSGLGRSSVLVSHIRGSSVCSRSARHGNRRGHCGFSIHRTASHTCERQRCHGPCR